MHILRLFHVLLYVALIPPAFAGGDAPLDCQNCACLKEIHGRVFGQGEDEVLPSCRFKDAVNPELHDTISGMITRAQIHMITASEQCAGIWAGHINRMDVGKRAFLSANAETYRNLAALFDGSISNGPVIYSAMEDFILTDAILTKADDGCMSFALPFIVRAENIELIKGVELDRFGVLEQDVLISLWYAAVHADMDYGFQQSFLEKLKRLEEKFGLDAGLSQSLAKSVEARRKLNGN